MALDLYRPRIEGELPPVATLPWNAHPPTSVLVTLPFALLDYPEAGTLWNILSLIALIASLRLIIYEFDFPVRAWSVAPMATLGLLCGPIRTQVAQGQWNAPLLLLLTLAWVAERRGRSHCAGFWVATAAALKLFPVFFLLYFAIRRRWRALIFCALWLVMLSFVSVAVLGPGAYRDYSNAVLPTLREYRSDWNNTSVAAFWIKNFATGATHYGVRVEAVIRAPLLAHAGIVASYTLVLAAMIFSLNKLRVTENHDRFQHDDICYAMTIVAMLILTPVCWDHYLLLLALPVFLIWLHLGSSSLERVAFPILIMPVWVSASELWRLGGVDLLREWPDFQSVPGGTYIIHRPLFLLFFLSVHFYALLALYVWLVWLARWETAVGGHSMIPEQEKRSVCVLPTTQN